MRGDGVRPFEKIVNFFSSHGFDGEAFEKVLCRVGKTVAVQNKVSPVPSDGAGELVCGGGFHAKEQFGCFSVDTKFASFIFCLPTLF